MPLGLPRSLSTSVLALLVAGACRDAPVPPPRPTTLETYPHAMERLARLMRAEYAAADPRPIEQAIACETARVKRVLGADFEVRRRHLTDSLAEEFSAEQTRQLGMRLSGATVADGADPACVPINQAAESEVPLDTAKRWHTEKP
jgi:hypothetical protein